MVKKEKKDMENIFNKTAPVHNKREKSEPNFEEAFSDGIAYILRYTRIWGVTMSFTYEKDTHSYIMMMSKGPHRISRYFAEEWLTVYQREFVRKILNDMIMQLNAEIEEYSWRKQK